MPWTVWTRLQHYKIYSVPSFCGTVVCTGTTPWRKSPLIALAHWLIGWLLGVELRSHDKLSGDDNVGDGPLKASLAQELETSLSYLVCLASCQRGGVAGHA